MLWGTSRDVVLRLQAGQKWSCGHLGLEDKGQPRGTNNSYERGRRVGEQELWPQKKKHCYNIPEGRRGKGKEWTHAASLFLPLTGQKVGEPRWGCSRVQFSWRRAAQLRVDSQTVTQLAQWYHHPADQPSAPWVWSVCQLHMVPCSMEASRAHWMELSSQAAVPAYVLCALHLWRVGLTHRGNSGTPQLCVVETLLWSIHP